MKKFVAVAAAGTIALLVSTTAYGRVMPGTMMKVQSMENKVEHKGMMLNKKITKWTNKRAIQNIERARQRLQAEKRKLMELKQMLSSSSMSSSSVSSATSSAATSSMSSAQ